MLFPCLAFGFFGIAWALATARRGRPASILGWAATPVVLGLGAIALWDPFPLLIGTAIGAVTVAVLAILVAKQHRDKVTISLFSLYIAGSLILPPLGARPHQSAELQWIEESTNSVIQLCFVLGALRLLSRAQRTSAL